MGKKVNIIGAGLTGAISARVLTEQGYDVEVFEQNKIGGMCYQTDKYQKFIHILHTDNKKVWNFIKQYTDIKPYRHYVWQYGENIKQEYPAYKPKNDEYGFKVWGTTKTPLDAKKRNTTQFESFFKDKYQGIPNFQKLFENLLENIPLYKKKIKYKDLSGKTILTGNVDEYFKYKYGKLHWRGIASTHIKTKYALPVGQINFSDSLIPILRMIDYQRLGFDGYIGIEYPSKGRHYPVRDKISLERYAKYKKMAKKNNIVLAGRLGKYKYMDMDKCIEEII